MGTLVIFVTGIFPVSHCANYEFGTKNTNNTQKEYSNTKKLVFKRKHILYIYLIYLPPLFYV